jgi:uncharacterized protein (UPF0297 family)
MCAGEFVSVYEEQIEEWDVAWWPWWRNFPKMGYSPIGSIVGHVLSGKHGKTEF